MATIDRPCKTAPRAIQAALTLLALMIPGCSGSTPPTVVVYTALDSDFSEPIFGEYRRTSHVEVLAKFDTESTKSVGLAEEIIAEADRPHCDVYWNNEILNTLRLEKRGLLEVYRSPAAQNFPALYRSPQGTWQGFAARARILLINTDLVATEARPKSIHDLEDPRWRGKVGMAKPLFGTTATHAACLFAYWNDTRARDFFRALKENQIQVLSGNKQVALAVGTGRIAIGWTDTDDAIAEVEKGQPVVIIYPDQEKDGIGTLFIPNTLAIVKNCPHPEAARELVDYLLSPGVESGLALGDSAQIPLNPAVHVKLKVESPHTVRPMAVNFDAAAAKWDTAAKFLRDEFTAD